MTTTIFKAQTVEMTEFENLFIELTAKNCNQRCKHCYIDFPINKNIKDFIQIETVKNSLLELKSEKIKCIYLTGAEPMTHPDFNQILRMCLKKTNVCICTNGTFINEKKARFLKKVEDEGTNEIIFKLSIDHFDELKNDEIRSRGAYRTTLNAIKYLNKYNFNPILCITNFYKESEETLIEEFTKICKKIDYDIPKSNFCINNCIDKHSDKEINNNAKPDCSNSRCLTSKGVYTCPFLANDHRGRCGSNFTDYSKHNSLETEYCIYCTNNQNKYFGINYKLFET